VVVFEYEELLADHGMSAVVDHVIKDCSLLTDKKHEVVFLGHSLGAQVAINAHKKVLDSVLPFSSSCVLINPAFTSTFNTGLKLALGSTNLVPSTTQSLDIPCPTLGYASDDSHGFKFVTIKLIESCLSHIHEHPVEHFMFQKSNRVMLVSGLGDILFPLPQELINQHSNIKFIEGLDHLLPLDNQYFPELIAKVIKSVLCESETCGIEYLRF
jgi:pimeloyl-ACP methyl ester carboxylesterase